MFRYDLVIIHCYVTMCVVAVYIFPLMYLLGNVEGLCAFLADTCLHAWYYHWRTTMHATNHHIFLFQLWLTTFTMYHLSFMRCKRLLQ